MCVLVPGWGYQGVRSAIAVPGEAGRGSAPALRRAETGLGVRQRTDDCSRLSHITNMDMAMIAVINGNRRAVW